MIRIINRNDLKAVGKYIDELEAEIKKLKSESDYLSNAFMETETIAPDGELRGSIAAMQKEIERLRKTIDAILHFVERIGGGSEYTNQFPQRQIQGIIDEIKG